MIKTEDPIYFDHHLSDYGLCHYPIEIPNSLLDFFIRTITFKFIIFAPIEPHFHALVISVPIQTVKGIRNRIENSIEMMFFLRIYRGTFVDLFQARANMAYLPSLLFSKVKKSCLTCFFRVETFKENLRQSFLANSSF